MDESKIVSILAPNIVGLCTALLLILMVNSSEVLEKRKKFLLLFAVSINICLICLELGSQILRFYDTGNEVIHGFNLAITTTYWILVPVIPIILFIYIFPKKLQWYYYLPFAVSAMMVFLSLFYPFVFTYAYEDGRYNYQQGMFYFLPIVAASFYVLLILIYSLTDRNSVESHERITITVIGVIIIGLVAYEYFYLSNGIIFNICAVLLMVFYFFTLLSKLRVDGLTSLLSHHKLILDLNEYNHKSNLIIVMCDIDNFKSINDEYGHLTGDKIIASIAQLIKTIFENYGRIYRAGGDEFAMLLDASKINIDETKKLIESVEDNDWEIKLSYGIVPYHRNDDIKDSLNEADAMMYHFKKDIKNNEDRSKEIHI